MSYLSDFKKGFKEGFRKTPTGQLYFAVVNVYARHIRAVRRLIHPPAPLTVAAAGLCRQAVLGVQCPWCFQKWSHVTTYEDLPRLAAQWGAHVRKHELSCEVRAQSRTEAYAFIALAAATISMTIGSLYQLLRLFK